MLKIGRSKFTLESNSTAFTLPLTGVRPGVDVGARGAPKYTSLARCRVRRGRRPAGLKGWFGSAQSGCVKSCRLALQRCGDSFLRLQVQGARRNHANRV